MEHSKDQRALEVLGDYLFELETNDKGRGSSYGQNRTLAAMRFSRSNSKPQKLPTPFDIHAEYSATLWEKDQFKVWKAHGRIAEGGRLRVDNKPLAPYTLKDLMRIMPHLNVFDRMAALIDLNGIVKEGYLQSKEHENIRAVIEGIADERLTRRLQAGDTTLVLRDLVRKEVSEIFGEVLARFTSPISTAKPGGRTQKCSKCRQPGHRATTCGKRIDMPGAAAAPAEEAGEESEAGASA